MCVNVEYTFFLDDERELSDDTILRYSEIISLAADETFSSDDGPERAVKKKNKKLRTEHNNNRVKSSVSTRIYARDIRFRQPNFLC